MVLQLMTDFRRCILDPEIAADSRRVWRSEASDMVGMASPRYLGSISRTSGNTQLLHIEERVCRTGSVGAYQPSCMAPRTVYQLWL
jgi:hypothetical protein